MNFVGRIGEQTDEPRLGRQETQREQQRGRTGMRAWLDRMGENAYLADPDIVHTVRFWLGDGYQAVAADLEAFGAAVPAVLEPAVAENDFRFNLPRVEQFNGIGERDDRVVHHPTYAAAGNAIYGTDVVKRLARPGGLCEGMAFYLLSSYAGEAGHNCPLICNFETARLLRQMQAFDERDRWVELLETPSYDDNFTASQFLTEVQGGSDVGRNATRARKAPDGSWRIRGEKWFCSNANADLMVISARHDDDAPGTRGLSVFIVPARKPDGSRNDFTFRRLKEKMGTRALASAEIDFHDAYAVAAGDVDRGFNRMMEQVIHYSRLALAVSVLGMSERAYQTARAYADTREAFGDLIANYPLVQDNLASIKADIATALAGTYALLHEQDKADRGEAISDDMRAFLRLMANLGKSVVSRRCVDTVHHAIDAMGGNGAIETTSSLPRLLRDTVIYENWEGTHNTLIVQVQRDFAKYGHDDAYFRVLDDYVGRLPESLAAKAAETRRMAQALRRDLETAKTADAGLQSVMLKDLLTRMADLFYYTALLIEAADQSQSWHSDSKLAAAEYFRRSRLEDGPMRWSPEALELIRAAISL